MHIHNGDHMQFEIDNAHVPPKERPDWPWPSFDAKDWAESMCARFGIHESDFLPWCAAMLMRGYDEGRAKQIEYQQREAACAKRSE